MFVLTLRLIVDRQAKLVAARLDRGVGKRLDKTIVISGVMQRDRDFRGSRAS
jgi:hypothetical protein